MPLQSEWKTIEGQNGPIRAFISSMKGVADPRPTVIVIQEIWGVNAHIQDLVTRFANAGYVAIAPDLFAEKGVRPVELSDERITEAKVFLHSTPHSVWYDPEVREAEILKQPEERQEALRTTLQLLFGVLDPSKSAGFISVLKDTSDYARDTFEKTKGMPVTSIGFCLGGALSAILATVDPKHAGSVVFYGRPPKQNIDKIQCPIIGFYGGEDPNITNLVQGFEDEMKNHHKSFEAIIYPNGKHAFFNDTNPTYHAGYARDSFAKSLSFLSQVTTV